MFLGKTALTMQEDNISICDSAQLHVLLPPVLGTPRCQVNVHQNRSVTRTET